MEQTAEPGTIQLAPDMRALLAERFVLMERGVIEVRGKGFMRPWLLHERKEALAAGLSAADETVPLLNPASGGAR
jgi:adenylate cyclase